MGQKVNPIGNRLGIIKGWDSNWYGGKDYSAKLVEDNKIREYLNARLAKASISKIIIERTLKLITVTVNTARPGIIIGKGGQEVDKLKEELKKITRKEVQINIFEVKRPELDATIVASNIARQVEGKISYRRAIKMAIASTMRMGAEGIKVLISDCLFPLEPRQLASLFRDADYAILVQLLAGFEAEPEVGGKWRLVDAETGDHLDVSLDQETVRGYGRRLRSLQDGMDRQMRMLGGAFAVVCDLDPWEQVMRSLLRAGIVEVN